REVGLGSDLIPVGEQAVPQWKLRTVLGTQMTRSMRRRPIGGSFETTIHGIPSKYTTSPTSVSGVWSDRTRSLGVGPPRTSSYAGTCRSPPTVEADRGDPAEDPLSIRLIRLFAIPVIERFDAADHADAAPHHLLRARVPADVVRLARAPREEGQAVLATAEAM